jgi:hypothetical protein
MAGWRARPWRHYDPEMQARGESGWLRAQSQNWTGPENDVVADLRGYLVLSAYHQARLGGILAESTDTNEIAIQPEHSGNGERDWAQRTMYNTLDLLSQALAQHIEPPSDDADEFVTQTPAVWETGILPAWAVIAVVAVGVAGVGWIAYRASFVIDRELQRNDSMRQMMHADSQVQQLIDQHTQREDAAGRHLPLDDATKMALSQLKQRQDRLVIEPPAPATIVDSWFELGAIGAGLVAAYYAARKGWI